MKFRSVDSLLPISIMLTPFVSSMIALFGHPRIVFDAFYNRVWQDDSKIGFYSAILAASILVMALIWVFTRASIETITGTGVLGENFLLFLGLSVLISVGFNFHVWGFYGLAKVAIYFGLCLAFLKIGITRRSFEVSGSLVLFSYFLILAFPLVSGQNSWTGCREDKCTALGNLFTSFFQSENALALYVLTTMYFVTFLRNKKLVALGFVLSPLLCYLSGSRIGFASALLVALIFLLKKGQVLIWGPAIFSIGSLFLFATGTGSDLTGRGNIFESVRQIWLSSPIFGVGPGATQSAFQKGLVVGFVPFNEQTEIAHVLAEFGLIVCLVFVCLLFLVTTKGRKFDKDGIQAATITPFLIASLAFITEVTVSFSIESTSFWISALLFAKVQSDLGQEFPSSLKAIN